MADFDFDRLKFAITVGLVAMLIDLVFHTLATTPEETPLYFAAKFTWASVTAFVLHDFSTIRGAFAGGAVFDVLVGVYYFFAFYTRNTALSCCFLSPPAVVGLPSSSWFVFYGYPIGPWFAAFATVHFLAFAVSFALVKQA